MKKKLIIFFTLLQISCVGFHVTNENGYRLNNPKDFKYNKLKYKRMDKSAIDTSSIYIMDSICFKWMGQNQKRCDKGFKFVRFFSGGQALFVNNDGIPKLEKINNRNIGVPAYYIIEGDKIKVNIFQTINGGQTIFYFGKIQENGNILFYEEGAISGTFPIRTFKSFKSLESIGNKSYWTKMKIKDIDHYKPDW